MVPEAVLTAAVAPSGEAAPPAVGSDQPSLPTPRPHSPTFEGLDLEPSSRSVEIPPLGN